METCSLDKPYREVICSCLCIYEFTKPQQWSTDKEKKKRINPTSLGSAYLFCSLADDNPNLHRTSGGHYEVEMKY